ncbi:Eukaryotic translation initiation factor 3 subunit A [Lamellibrachia satsuma]|nr:Eukaryotic translation initiation factor 3 subunit A [Lamellibrachia satsuma]
MLHCVEFIDVGKKQRALDALYDVIKSKKHRTWQKIHEPIMEKYLQLCVDLKKSHIAKEGLYQYKNICQQVNIKSLEDVIRKYLQLAESKTEAAREESHQAVIDVDDLDVIQTPENLLLSAVSGEDSQDRNDRAILTPWVKFLWESYRQCLDLLRNNNSVEKLYQDVAQMAFKFCLKYERKTEFRKLCDNLRTHLSQIHKHQHQQRAINLDKPESQAMHLETRLVQLDSAIQMELWQEAFKAVEDIHGLISLSKKPSKPSLMSNYYNKLGLVFWKSGSCLFHACAWHRLYQLSREQRRNLTPEELQRLASRVVCATLAVPISQSYNPIDQMLQLDENTQEKQRRLATLLGLPAPPTRSALVKDLMKYNMVQHVYPEIKNLYHFLEVEFHPLKLSGRVTVLLDFLGTKEDLAPYVSALQDITITRLLKQVSQVYQTIEFERLAALAPFVNNFHLERVIVNVARQLRLQVRIDHRTRSLSFGTDLGVSQNEDLPEGPYLQSMPSEQIRNQLTYMAQAIDKAITLIKPTELQSGKEELRAHIIQSYRQTARKEHARILQRRQIIEERKEELENANVQREREEQELMEEAKRKQIEAEMARLEREAEEREKQRRLEEHREIQRKAARERLEQLKSTALGARAFEGIDEEVMADMDVDDILAKQVEQLEKEKKELQEKLKSQEKKVDFFERAKHIEEIPLLEKQCEDEMEKAKEFWEQQEQERIENLKSERMLALEQRDRLMRMVTDKTEFVNKLQANRMSDFKEKRVKFEKKLSEERKKRLTERKSKRKEERRAKWIQAKEEEEQRKHDEELKRQREEEERKEREEREREEEEYSEKLRKLEVAQAKQREREREIEERLMRQKEEESRRREEREYEQRRGDDRDRSGGSAWRPVVKEGGWRERTRLREESWKRPEFRHDEPDHDRDEPRRDMGARDIRLDEQPQREMGARDVRLDEPRRDFGARDVRLDEPKRDFGARDIRLDEPKQDFGARDVRLDERPRRDFGARDIRLDEPRGDFGARDVRLDEPRRGMGSRDIRLDEDSSWRSAPREDRSRVDRDWSDRGPPRGDDYDRRDRGRDTEDRGWRDRGPPRDDRGPPRDDRGPPRDDRRPPREDRWGAPPSRDGWRGDDRRGDDRRDMPARDGWRDRVAPQDDRDGWRSDRRVLPPREDRDEERGGGAWRGGGRDRERGADDWRGGGGGGRWGDERRGPPRDERGPYRDERGPPRDERGPPRDERGPPREERRPFRDERGPPMDDAGPPRNDWRDRGLKERASAAPPKEKAAPTASEPDEDGWTTVQR